MMEEQPQPTTEEPMDDGAKIAMLLAAVPSEDQEDMPTEEAPEEPKPDTEDMDSAMPSADILADLYSAIYGDAFNSESEDAMSKMANLEGMLAERPEIADAIAKGEIGVAEAALMMFRQINV